MWPKIFVRHCRFCKPVHWAREMFCPDLLLLPFQELSPGTSGKGSAPQWAVSKRRQTRVGESSLRIEVMGTMCLTKGGGVEGNPSGKTEKVAGQTENLHKNKG